MPHDQLPPFVLKDGETFAMLDGRGEICPETHPDSGIFHRGTRHVSRLQLLLWGQSGAVLSSTERGGMGVHVSHLTNASSALGPPQGVVHIERSSVLTPTSCLQELCFTNYGEAELDVPLTLCCDADFRDIFEVRGLCRPQRGHTVLSCRSDALEWRYQGLDGELRCTEVRLGTPLHEVGDDHLSLAIRLAPRQPWRLVLELTFHRPQPLQLQPSPEAAYGDAIAATIARCREARRRAAVISSDNPAFNAWLARSYADGHLLASEHAHGLYPYAGVPWFSCPFGRDGLITARQLLLVEPRLARGVLGFLAESQAQADDRSSDAEPGKILHEARFGEMAALGEVPFGRYYGTVDATPLFVILAADYLARSGEIAFNQELLPALEAAMAWIQRAEAGSVDGFLRYRCAAQGGLRNQGWKDSDDAVHHSDGRLAEGSIALCEVQAYSYGAHRAMAAIQRRFGRHDTAETLLNQADALRTRFHAAFWCASIGTYAMAIDGEGQPCAVRSSNAGHCLWTGIATPEAAASIARQLLAPSSFNGWGVRTLDEREARYNPMSYHNGSVWPHDNALIALGLARYGYRAEAMRLFTGLFDTARAMPMLRLPELFCGFSRRDDEGPTHYPVACSPQAWASGAVFALLEAVTGMAIGREETTGRVQVQLRHPVLPPDINVLEIGGLRLAEEEIDLQLHRGEHDVGVLVRRRTSGVDVLISK
ncbi:MAG: amylo-alpha-1,6-glucosidase [Cyanobacteria bacterium K_DeepCast_35m_m2_023]|nr:amylo-alpha-1,6-glucosidase [Cyanobacteria bacterium K_DeepCast_35m_m2_023]